MTRLIVSSVLLLAVVAMIFPSSLSAQSDDPSTAIAEGDIMFTEGEYAKARAIYTQVLSADPDNVRALNNRGVALVRLEKMTAALADLTRALELEKRNGNLWNNRANVNCDLQRYKEAFQDRQAAFYNGRFSLEQAQTTLRRLGYFRGLTDAVWDVDEDLALKDWTEAGCPNAPGYRLIVPSG